MMAICTGTGTPHLVCVSRLAAYQSSCSLKIAQTLAGSAGGVVAQPAVTMQAASRPAGRSQPAHRQRPAAGQGQRVIDASIRHIRFEEQPADLREGAFDRGFAGIDVAEQGGRRYLFAHVRLDGDHEVIAKLQGQ